VFAAASLLAAGAAARAQTRRWVLGPVEMKGKQVPMMGPYILKSLEFEKPGWVRRFKTVVLDREKKPVEDSTVFCHATFRMAERFRNLGRTLTVSEGFNEIAFPEGFGLPVDAGEKHAFNLMLQSDGPEHDGMYYFDVTVDMVERGGPEKLKSLIFRLIDITSFVDQEDAIPMPGMPLEWWVPPGKHVYRQKFSQITSERVHYMSAHIHRYGTGYRLMHPASGTILFDGKTVQDGARRLEGVSDYSSVEGILLREGEEYEFSVFYDNPLKTNIAAMGTLSLFARPEAP